MAYLLILCIFAFVSSSLCQTTSTPCSTADDCPFLHCCMKHHGNSVDSQLQKHPELTNAIIGRRATHKRGHCQPMKGRGEPCWTKTDVAYLAPHEMTDDCPCQRGLYCVANGVFLPGGQVGWCSV